MLLSAELFHFAQGDVLPTNGDFYEGIKDKQKFL